MTTRNDISNLLPRFENAIESLATGPKDVRSRLQSAFLQISVFRPKDIPSEIQADFNWVLDRLTSKEPQYPGEGRLQSTLRQMKNSTGSKIAQRIFDMYKYLVRELANGN